jgi:penicillin-binding protein 1A
LNKPRSRKKTAKKNKNKGWKKLTSLSWKKLAGLFAGFFLVCLILAIILFYQTVRLGLFGALPNEKDLSNIQNAVASEVYTADGKLLGKYYVQERTHAPYEKISPHIINALIATEDARFYEHNGVDRRSLLRVVVKTLMLQDESAGGGSTISQQLAKNLFSRTNRYGFLSMPVNKVREAIIAQRLENVYSKKEILTLYLNTVSFGDNSFGIETAAERFFSKDSDKLNQQEAAVLVGMLKATHNYNPRLFPKEALRRRNTVIHQMEKYNYLSAREADSLQQTELLLQYNRQSHHDGLATYFRQHLRKELEDWCRNNPKPDGGSYNLYTDGLKIYTTLHSELQSYAEDAMKQHMKQLQKDFFKHWEGSVPWKGKEQVLLEAIRRSNRYKNLKKEGLSEEEIQKNFKEPVPMKVFSWDGIQEKKMSPLDSVKYYLHFLNAGMLAMEPQTGAIKAWVGGINHTHFQYDHVNKRTKRQVGSTFKPIVYAAALQQGADPCTYIPASRETYAELENWSPGNSDGNYEGEYTLQGGLMNSVNTVSVKVLKKTGLSNTINLAKAMGIESTIPKEPSIALGTAEISLYEMVTAYSILANEGQTIRPHYLLRIEDRQGRMLEDFEPEGAYTQALSTEQAGTITHMLKGVINEGTASRLRWKYGLKNDIAGKTGTTQSHADGWFMGMTPKLVVGVWVGADNPAIRFRTTNLGQGANTALPIFALFLQKVNADKRFKELSNARFNGLPPELLASLESCPPYRKEEELENQNIFDRIFGKKEEKEENSSVNGTENKKTNTRRKQPARKKKKKGFFERVFGGG